MNQRALLIVASLLSVLLFTVHIADDISRGFEKGNLQNLPAIPMAVIWLFGTVVLTCGAAARILIVPGACRLLGFNPGHWIAFDAASLVLAALGLAFTALAAVLRHASAVQSELDEMF